MGLVLSVSGIWQTVFIEPRAPVFVEYFEITSDLERGLASFKILTNGGSECALEITAPDGGMLSELLSVTDGVAVGNVALGQVALWDPGNPQLYTFKMTLRGATKEDVVFGYFGMRSISTMRVEESSAPAALSFNGKAIYLRGALYQSYFPDGIYTAGDVQLIKDDIAYAKRCGFDLLRIHIKIDDPLLLYWADTLGVLLLADFPNFGEGGDTPLGRRRYEEAMRGAIRRDFNHPSIIGWCLFNETWGFGGQSEFVKLINPQPPFAGPEVNCAPAPSSRTLTLSPGLIKCGPSPSRSILPGLSRT